MGGTSSVSTLLTITDPFETRSRTLSTLAMSLSGTQPSSTKMSPDAACFSMASIFLASISSCSLICTTLS